MPQVRLGASNVGGLIQTSFSGNVAVGADGTITVDARDAAVLLAAGCTYMNTITKNETFALAPRGATAARIVSSATITNGTLTVANQPDVGRRCTITVFSGSTGITAGQVSFPYTANDGTTTTDVFPLALGSTATATNNTSKGVLVAGSAVISGFAGAANAGIQIDDTNFLAMSVDPGFVDFTELKENSEGGNQTLGTLAASAGCISPTVQPNATHTYGFSYAYLAPDI